MIETNNNYQTYTVNEKGSVWCLPWTYIYIGYIYVGPWFLYCINRHPTLRTSQYLYKRIYTDPGILHAENATLSLISAIHFERQTASWWVISRPHISACSLSKDAHLHNGCSMQTAPPSPSGHTPNSDYRPACLHVRFCRCW